MDTLIGTSLQGGKYTLDEELGRGGFGITFKATHHFLGHVVVIKTLNEGLRKDPNYYDFQRKFQDEARRLALCNHPNIVRISDYFVEADRAYMVMDYIPGPTLEEVVFPNHPLPEAIAVLYMRQIASALKVVHQNGLLHRDIKPQNIILRHGTDQVVLIDFGIAREFKPGSMQTHTNLISTGYAPIEQYMAREKRTPATDVYGLAATLYSLLTAQVPVASILRDRQPMPAPRDLVPSLSAAVNQAVLRGMAIEVRHRPASIDEWLSLLPGNSAPVSVTRPPDSAPASLPNRTGATVPLIPRHPTPQQTEPIIQPGSGAIQGRSPVIPAPRSSRFGPLSILVGLSALTLVGVTATALFFKGGQEQQPIVEQTNPAPSPSSITESPKPAPIKPSPSPSPSPQASQPTEEPTPPPDEKPAQPKPEDGSQSTQPIRGFPTGSSEGEIKATLGEPTSTNNGVWDNTRTALYEQSPNVTLGYIYDRATSKVRQTEASFAPSVDSLQMQVALNGMMGSQAPANVLDGLKKVARRQQNEYTFSTGNLKGIIQRNAQDRIYVAVWDADLHD
ncbi:protein kinase [Kovacikia minuta CCNUW1]|uniref:serine/threonine protein kinase n=1 Tax=Kovacikia minuta TaxID=2931930 RepID=UPI001CC92058|nr:serine/threonine-protein kinase [Kovacikia minuta]UBF23622.1 protein kinase [Kovacikia minuta CCNUW1]